VSLKRRTKSDRSANPEQDYLLLHGNMPVARIYSRQSAFSADAKWLWTLNGVIGGPADLRLAGTSPSSEAAEAEVNANWQRWLRWAKLTESVRT
jgi:hypothetical protein